MEPLLSSAQMEQADRYTIDNVGIHELVLMEHAAMGVVRALERRFGSSLGGTGGVVIAGNGNNGGDAVAVARSLGHRVLGGVNVLLVGRTTKPASRLAHQLEIARKLGLSVVQGVCAESLARADWIVDGIFGTGLSRNVESEFRDAIREINVHYGRKWIVAIDVPSGLSSDTGLPLGNAVQASETVCLGFLKQGLVTGEAADYVGNLRLETIQIPRTIPGVEPSSFLFTEHDARVILPVRKRSGHKGHHGHVFVWCAEREKGGASALCALAALRAGCGLVTVVGHPSDVQATQPRLIPEVMTETSDMTFFSGEPRGVCVLGPGLGAGEGKWALLERALGSRWPLVLDADAITIMASHGAEVKACLKSREVSVALTPHPKEAARLLGVGVKEIQADRYRACEKLVDSYPCTVVLKGRGTLIAHANAATMVVNTGDTGLSKGGSGDILSGVIGSLMAQGLSTASASALGTFLHGRASEYVSQSKGTERATLASEVAQAIPDALREVECT